MTFECPAWLQHWLGVGPASGDESVVGRIELLRPPSATITLLIALAAVAAAWYCYRRADGAGRRVRIIMAVLRLAVFALLIALVGELSITLRRAGLPTVVVLVDDSESMNIDDRYVDEEFRRELIARIGRFESQRSRPSSGSSSSAAPRADGTSGDSSAGPATATRLQAVRTLLLEHDAAFLRRLLDRNYQLRVFTVSDAARLLPHDVAELSSALDELKATGKSTRLGDGLRSALEQLRGQPIAAVVLLSDGVNTAGGSLSESAAAAARRNIPLFTVALGETKKAVDVELSELKTRDYVMVNDLVSFDFTLTGRGIEGRSVELSLREADEKTPAAVKTATVGKDDVGTSIRLTYRPTKVGTFRYVVEAKSLLGEADLANNRLEATIEVRTDKVEVLMAFSYPSFEYRYLKQMLQRDETVRVMCVLEEADQDYPRIDASVTTLFPVTLDDLLKFDVIVLGDVDPEFLGASTLTQLREFVTERGRGMVFASGPRFMPAAYRDTPLADLIPIDWTRLEVPPEDAAGTSPIGVRLAPDALEEAAFQLGDTSEQSTAVWQGLAPIYWLVHAERRKSAQVMVETRDQHTNDGRRLPVVLFQRAGRGMALFHATDETWRWRYRVGDLYFARYWVQALRYLALAKGSGRPVVVRAAKDEFAVGRPVPLEVRFQDERFAPTDSQVSVVIESEGRADRTITLAPRRNLRNIYETTVTGLPEGRYRVRLSGTFEPPAAAPGENRPDSVTADEFRVAALRAESTPLEADHESLTVAAHEGKGAFFAYANAEELFERLPRGRLLPTEPLPPVGLWNKWFTLLLMLSLLVGEWVLRKRGGLI